MKVMTGVAANRGVFLSMEGPFERRPEGCQRNFGGGGSAGARPWGREERGALVATVVAVVAVMLQYINVSSQRVFAPQTHPTLCVNYIPRKKNWEEKSQAGARSFKAHKVVRDVI